MKKIVVSNRFVKFKRISPEKLQLEIDNQVNAISDNPGIGTMKRGVLKGINLHRFRFETKPFLLLYEVVDDTLQLYLIGRYGKYYDKLKKTFSV